MKKNSVLLLFSILLGLVLSSCGAPPMHKTFSQLDTTYMIKAYGLEMQLPWDPCVDNPHLRKLVNDSVFSNEIRQFEIQRTWQPENVYVDISFGRYAGIPNVSRQWDQNSNRIKESYQVADIIHNTSKSQRPDSVDLVAYTGQISKKDSIFLIRNDIFWKGSCMWSICIVYPDGDPAIKENVNRIFNSLKIPVAGDSL